jgi:putative sterol carrier protein
MAEEKKRKADELMSLIEERLNKNKEATKNWGKTVHLIFTDIDTGYRLRFAMDGSNTIEKEEASKMKSAEAQATVSTTVDTLKGVIDGTSSPVLAVMSGKIKIDGEMGTLMKLLPAFQ